MLLFSVVLFLGAMLCLILTMITGATNSSFLGKFYWLQTDCSKYSGAPIDGQCRWTSYGLCAVSDGNNYNCTKAKPDYAFSPKDNFDTTDDVPDKFISNRTKFFYMSRIGWAFEVIALFFMLVLIIPFCIYVIGQSTVPIWRIAFWACYYLTFIFVVVAMALLTAVYIDGKQVFKTNDNSAKLGARPLATAWVTVFSFIVNTFVLVWLLMFNNNLVRYGNARLGPLVSDPAAEERQLGDRLSMLSERAESRGGTRFMDRLDEPAPSYRSSSAPSSRLGSLLHNRSTRAASTRVDSGSDISADGTTQNASSFLNNDEYEAQVQNVMQKLQAQQQAASK